MERGIGSIAALAAAGIAWAIAGCVPVGAEVGEPLSVVEDGCSDDDLHIAESCEDEYCGPPIATIGTGGSEFLPIEDDDALTLYFGSNGGSGGYHLFLSAKTERLCDIVWLEPRVQVYVDGAWETIYEEQLHVLAVRPEEGSSEQLYWGIRATIPCAFWPHSEERNSCGPFQSRRGFIDDMRVRVSVTATDHDGRTDTDRREVTAACCGD